MMKRIRQNLEELYLWRVRRRRALLKAHVTPEVIALIEEHFEAHLPAFQGHAGSYDPLDAMRRDAQREVCLWLRREIGAPLPDVARIMNHLDDNKHNEYMD